MTHCLTRCSHFNDNRYGTHVEVMILDRFISNMFLLFKQYPTIYALKSEEFRYRLFNCCPISLMLLFELFPPIIYLLTPELNPSAQCCLMRYFTGDFAS
jgi:hypothetical protein